MTIKYSKRFRKQFKKLRKNEQERFWKQLGILIQNPNAVILNHHVLRGKYAGLHSINIGGDLRAIFVEIDGNLVLFEMIGTHAQLYG